MIITYVFGCGVDIASSLCIYFVVVTASIYFVVVTASVGVDWTWF